MKKVVLSIGDGPMFLATALGTEVCGFLRENKNIEACGSVATFLAVTALLFRKHGSVERALEEAKKLLWDGDILAEVEMKEVENDLKEILSSGELGRLLEEISEYLMKRIRELQKVRTAEDALVLASYLA